jgi:hypothetical protein
MSEKFSQEERPVLPLNDIVRGVLFAAVAGVTIKGFATIIKYTYEPHFVALARDLEELRRAIKSYIVLTEVEMDYRKAKQVERDIRALMDRYRSLIAYAKRIPVVKETKPLIDSLIKASEAMVDLCHETAIVLLCARKGKFPPRPRIADVCWRELAVDVYEALVRARDEVSALAGRPISIRSTSPETMTLTDLLIDLVELHKALTESLKERVIPAVTKTVAK